MKVYNSEYFNIKHDVPITLAIGNFDGVHIGHQQIMKLTKSFHDTKSAVMSFTPHPVSVITQTNVSILMHVEDKIKALENLNVDYFFNIHFTLEFSQLSKEAFIEFLKSIHVKRIVVGKDFRFGFRGSGTIKDLESNFELIIAEDYLFKNIRVSTTYIKSRLDQGDLEEVKTLLNREYSIHGKVVHGDKIGSLIGFPTANIDYDHYYLPKIGVYIVTVEMDGKKYKGCASLGHNPTLNYSATKRLEVFILNYDGNLYDKEIHITFKKYLRNEEKFDSLPLLLEQIKKDVEETLEFFQKNPI